MKHWYVISVTLIVMGLCAAALSPTAFADDTATAVVVPDAGADKAEPTVGGVIDAFKGAEYLAAIAGLIYLIAMGLNAWWKPKTKLHKRLIAIGVAIAVTGAAAVYAGAPLTLGLGITTFIAALSASGINEDVKDVVRGKE